MKSICDIFRCQLKTWQPMSPIEEYLENVRAGTNGFERLFGPSVSILSTAWYASGINRPRGFQDPTVLKPSRWLRVPEYLIFAFFIGIWLLLLRSEIKHLQRGSVAPLIINSLILVAMFVSYFSRQNKHHEIAISAKDLSVGGRVHAWSDIEETGIMAGREGKSRRRYLMVFKKDKFIEEVELRYFWISNEKLSSTIEYFKRNAQTGK